MQGIGEGPENKIDVEQRLRGYSAAGQRKLRGRYHHDGVPEVPER